MSEAIYRVQDKEGRGPWKPGHSSLWVDDDTPLVGRAIFKEPGIMGAVNKAKKLKLHLGCAVRAGKMGIWFTERNLIKLNELGYMIVDASQCKVLFETDQQVLIGWTLPLYFLRPANGLDAPLPAPPREDGR